MKNIYEIEEVSMGEETAFMCTVLSSDGEYIGATTNYTTKELALSEAKDGVYA